MATLTKLTNYMETLHKFEVRGYEIKEVRSYISKAIAAVLDGNPKLARFQMQKAEEIKIELRADVALAMKQEVIEVVPAPVAYY